MQKIRQKQLAALSDPKFLPELEALAAAIFTDGFQDGHFYTLSSSVAKALAHCGVAAPQETKALLSVSAKLGLTMNLVYTGATTL